MLARTTIRTNDLPATASIPAAGAAKVLLLIDGKNKLSTLALLFQNINSDMIVNPDMGSVDVTINGQTKANLFKADAGLDRIGVGTNAPEALLHVMGDTYVGGTGAGKNGVLCLSNEVITVGETSVAVDVNNSFVLTNVKTLSTSSSTSTFTLNAPTKVNQQKIIVLSDTHADKDSNLNYVVTTTNCLGVASMKLTKLGDCISLCSVQYEAGLKWVLTAFNGAVIT